MLKDGSLEVLEKIVIHGNGAVQCPLNVKMLVFRPAIGSILDGTVTE